MLSNRLRVDSDSETYVCCDGKNDISLVRFVADRFKSYHVVCPSNISKELKESLTSGNFKHTILKQSCIDFGEGLIQILK